MDSQPKAAMHGVYNGIHTPTHSEVHYSITIHYASKTHQVSCLNNEWQVDKLRRLHFSFPAQGMLSPWDHLRGYKCI